MVTIGKNPIDNALFLFSSDIASESFGAEVYLKDFSSKSLSVERTNPLDFISITVGEGPDNEVVVFHSFREADMFLKEKAKEAPSIQDGADCYPVYVEWENKNGGAFRGFSAFYGNLFVTNEMEKTSNIVERTVAVRDMFDAGLLKPKGLNEEKWKEKQDDIGKRAEDKEYLISALRHMEGVKDQFRGVVRMYEIGKEKLSRQGTLKVPKIKRQPTLGKEDMEKGAERV